jgi:hypothetical protein
VNASFRLKRSCRNQSIAFLLGFSAWAAFAVAVAPTTPGVPNRLAALAFMAGVPLAMAGLSLWLLAAYYREELTIQNTHISFRGVLRRKEMTCWT